MIIVTITAIIVTIISTSGLLICTDQLSSHHSKSLLTTPNYLANDCSFILPSGDVSRPNRPEEKHKKYALLGDNISDATTIISSCSKWCFSQYWLFMTICNLYHLSIHSSIFISMYIYLFYLSIDPHIHLSIYLYIVYIIPDAFKVSASILPPCPTYKCSNWRQWSDENEWIDDNFSIYNQLLVNLPADCCIFCCCCIIYILEE